MIVLIVVFFFSTLVALVSTKLIFSSQYEDGFLGRLSLVILALAAFMTLFRGIDWIVAGMPPQHPFVPVGAMVWSGMGIFLGRHYLRWRRFTNRAPNLCRRKGDKVQGAK